MNNTWIKLHRNIIDWEWFHDKNCLMLLIYLNCRVNIVDKKWQGIVIKRGSMVLSWETLSNGINLSTQQCRTAMKKLVDSGEVVTESTNRYTLVSVAKWEKMQHEQQTDNKQITNKQQTDNKQITTTKERKESKEEKERREVLDIWLNYRKEIKKPIKSKSTIEALINKIELNGLEKSNAVIGTSIENGWQGLFWDKVQNKKNNTDPIKNLTF